MADKKLRIVILASPMALHSGVSEVVLKKFFEILKPLASRITIISGNLPAWVIKENQGFCYNAEYDTRGCALLIKVMKFLSLQIKLAGSLFRLRKEGVDLVFFWTGSATLAIPMVMAKLFGFKVASFILGVVSLTTQGRFGKAGCLVAPVLKIAEAINFNLADKLVVEAPGVLSQHKLTRYRNKTIVISLFVDTGKFFRQKTYKERDDLIVYLGRIEQAQKRVFNLLAAFSSLASGAAPLKLVIAGGGPLKEDLERKIKEENLSERIECRGWVEHNEIPELLNKAKFLILSSVTEGLPNVVIEAMACGTIVLATPAGGVPDVVKDAETGFLLKDATAQEIEKGILRVWSFPQGKLEEISKKASEFIKENYSYEAALSRAKKALEFL